MRSMASCPPPSATPPPRVASTDNSNIFSGRQQKEINVSGSNFDENKVVLKARLNTLD